MVALGKSSRPEAAGVAQDQAGVGSEVLGWRLLTPRNRVDLGSKTVYTMTVIFNGTDWRCPEWAGRW